jgi:hypothetical protein
MITSKDSERREVHFDEVYRRVAGFRECVARFGQIARRADDGAAVRDN